MAAPAVLKTLEFAWDALEPLQLPMALMGGLALSVWRYPRATRDVDILIGIGSRDPADVLTNLTAAGFRAKHLPPIRALGAIQIIQMDYDPRDAFVTISVDLLLVDSKYHSAALKRRFPIRLPGTAAEIDVLACEDLLLHKLIAGRIIDRSDAAALLRANHDNLDLKYLAFWVQKLSLRDDLQEVWREALGPGSTPPKSI
jgi:hypothetical protein